MDLFFIKNDILTFFCSYKSVSQSCLKIKLPEDTLVKAHEVHGQVVVSLAVFVRLIHEGFVINDGLSTELSLNPQQFFFEQRKEVSTHDSIDVICLPHVVIDDSPNQGELMFAVSICHIDDNIGRWME